MWPYTLPSFWNVKGVGVSGSGRSNHSCGGFNGNATATMLHLRKDSSQPVVLLRDHLEPAPPSFPERPAHPWLRRSGCAVLQHEEPGSVLQLEPAYTVDLLNEIAAHASAFSRSFVKPSPHSR